MKIIIVFVQDGVRPCEWGAGDTQACHLYQDINQSDRTFIVAILKYHLKSFGFFSVILLIPLIFHSFFSRYTLDARSSFKKRPQRVTAKLFYQNYCRIHVPFWKSMTVSLPKNQKGRNLYTYIEKVVVFAIYEH